MNNKVVLKIVVICAAVFVVFGILAAILAINTTWSDYRDVDFTVGRGEPFEYHKNEEFDLDGVTQININTVSSNVVFYESDELLEVTLDCKGYSKSETITLKTDQVGSNVNIVIKYPKTFWGSFSLTESLLQIGIPSDYAETIKVDGVSSRIKMDGYLKNTFKKLDFGTVSGDILINCAQVDVLKVNTTSGELSIEETLLNTVTADTTSGDIVISNLVSSDGKVDIDTVSGKVTLGYDELCETKVHTTSGDVNLNIPANTKIDLDFESVSGDIEGDYNKSSDGVSIQVDTVSGDLNIQ